MSASAGFVLGELAYQASPIIFTGGIAVSMGGVLPIIALTEGANLVASFLSGSAPTDLEGLFASFITIPGGTIASNDVPIYPLANQAVAANAIIANPLSVSVVMQVPVRLPYTFSMKLGLMTALQKTVQQHVMSGGTFTVVTPSYIYSNCLLLKITDVSDASSTKQQESWQWDFFQPLVSKAAAQSVLNSLMGKLAAGQPLTASPVAAASGLQIGNPSSLSMPTLVPQ